MGKCREEQWTHHQTQKSAANGWAPREKWCKRREVRARRQVLYVSVSSVKDHCLYSCNFSCALALLLLFPVQQAMHWSLQLFGVWFGSVVFPFVFRVTSRCQCLGTHLASVTPTRPSVRQMMTMHARSRGGERCPRTNVGTNVCGPRYVSARFNFGVVLSSPIGSFVPRPLPLPLSLFSSFPPLTAKIGSQLHYRSSLIACIKYCYKVHKSDRSVMIQVISILY